MNLSLEIIQRLLPGQPLLEYSTRVTDIRGALQQSASAPRIADWAAEQLIMEQTSTNERIQFVKLALAAHPHPAQLVRQLLGEEVDDNKLAWETRFTLFCYLDQLAGALCDAERQAVLQAVEQLLLRSEAHGHSFDQDSSAIFMAVDMLVEHWPVPEDVRPIVDRLMSAPEAGPATEAIRSALAQSTRETARRRGGREN